MNSFLQFHNIFLTIPECKSGIIDFYKKHKRSRLKTAEPS